MIVVAVVLVVVVVEAVLYEHQLSIRLTCCSQLFIYFNFSFVASNDLLEKIENCLRLVQNKKDKESKKDKISDYCS